MYVIYFFIRKKEREILNPILVDYGKILLQFFPFEGDSCQENTITISFFNSFNINFFLISFFFTMQEQMIIVYIIY